MHPPIHPRQGPADRTHLVPWGRAVVASVLAALAVAAASGEEPHVVVKSDQPREAATVELMDVMGFDVALNQVIKNVRKTYDAMAPHLARTPPPDFFDEGLVDFDIGPRRLAVEHALESTLTQDRVVAFVAFARRPEVRALRGRIETVNAGFHGDADVLDEQVRARLAALAGKTSGPAPQPPRTEADSLPAAREAAARRLLPLAQFGPYEELDATILAHVRERFPDAPETAWKDADIRAAVHREARLVVRIVDETFGKDAAPTADLMESDEGRRAMDDEAKASPIIEQGLRDFGRALTDHLQQRYQALASAGDGASGAPAPNGGKAGP